MTEFQESKLTWLMRANDSISEAVKELHLVNTLSQKLATGEADYNRLTTNELIAWHRGLAHKHFQDAENALGEAKKYD